MCDFDFDAPRRRVSDDRVLAALRRFAAQRQGRPFSRRQYNAWPLRPCGASSVAQRLRELARRPQEGRRQTPAPPPVHPRRTRLTPRTGLARPRPAPRIQQPPCPRRPLPRPYARHWGSLTQACRQLARFHKREITREELLRPEPLRRRGVIPPAVRWEVFKRDGHRCVACGASPAQDPSVRLEIDHTIPHAAGGSDDPTNLRTLCQTCNRGKSDRT